MGNPEQAILIFKNCHQNENTKFKNSYWKLWQHLKRPQLETYYIKKLLDQEKRNLALINSMGSCFQLAV
jgi:hypothetical protein